MSCVTHPVRNILHSVGCLLIQLSTKCAITHFNLYSVAEFTQRLAQYAAAVPPGDVLLSIYTDVKEMYTGMRHQESIAAVSFMLDRCKAV